MAIAEGSKELWIGVGGSGCVLEEGRGWEREGSGALRQRECGVGWGWVSGGVGRSATLVVVNVSATRKDMLDLRAIERAISPMAHPPTLRRYLLSQKADHLTHCYGGQHVEFPLPLKVLGASGLLNGRLEFAVVIAIW